MAERRFDPQRFEARLRAVALGRVLDVRERTGSTNDDAWALLAAGGPDGLAVIADEQLGGRGRAGRTWAHAPGKALAMSVGMRLGREAAVAGAMPLAVGLAVAEALATLGAEPRLKWPNDVLLGSRKVAGVLCELRRLPAGEAIVAGIGVNVGQDEADFPPELRTVATSLHLAGLDLALEDVAAAVCDALERRRAQLAAGDRAGVLAAWSARAAFWGEPVSVRGPAGEIAGVAQRLDDDGALVLRLESGAEWTAVAGDLLAGGADALEAR